jgi:hypothetical protein
MLGTTRGRRVKAKMMAMMTMMAMLAMMTTLGMIYLSPQQKMKLL